jgi:Fe-S cluster biogenesis protein NfuA
MIMGVGCFYFGNSLEVYSSRKIVVGFLGIHGGRAKVITSSVMVSGSRKIVAGYVGICNGCSVGHYGLLT